jgi:hypothetical protein
LYCALADLGAVLSTALIDKYVTDLQHLALLSEHG